MIKAVWRNWDAAKTWFGTVGSYRLEMLLFEHLVSTTSYPAHDTPVLHLLEKVCSYDQDREQQLITADEKSLELSVLRHLLTVEALFLRE